MHTKAAVLLNGIFPNATSALLSLGNRFLPGPAGSSTQTWSGSDSESFLAPKWLTRLSKEAAERNNEIVQRPYPNADRT